MSTITKDDINTTWVDIVTDLSLEDNVTYTIQNVSPYPLEIKVSSSLPAASEFGQVILPNVSWTVTIDLSKGVYIRNQKEDDNKLGKISITKAIDIAGPYVNNYGSEAQYPLSVNNDSIYCSDIDPSNSSIGNFSGSICDFFTGLTTTSLDSTSDNPKTIEVQFNRSQSFYSIALGCDDQTKTFSNVKITIYGSADSLLHTIDFSTDDTKRNSQTFAVASSVIFFGGNKIKFEFHTEDEIGLSNIIIFKSINANARIQAVSDLTNEVENVNSFRGALRVTDAFVHRAAVNEYFIRDVGPNTTLTIATSVGDTSITVVSSTGFAIGDLIKIGITATQEVGVIKITDVVGNVITLDRPVCCIHPIGTIIKEVSYNLASLAGTLSNPIIYELAPPPGIIWQITRLLINIVGNNSAMDDGTFGSRAALTNGVLGRSNTSAGRIANITNWKTNGDMMLDMFDIEYNQKAPSGYYGLRGRWTFTQAAFIAELNGDNNEWIRAYIQDDITANTSFAIKAQGRIFGL